MTTATMVALGLGIGSLFMALASLAWQAWTWRHRLSDERVRNDIRREVEESLRTQESRLRVEAEMRLRMHEKSWELLREIVATTYEVNMTTDEFLSNLKVPGRDQATKTASREQATRAVVRLVGAMQIAPPKYGLLNLAQPMLKALREAPDSNEKQQAAFDRLHDVRDACAKWNADLWESAGTLPPEGASGRPAKKP